MVYKNFENTKSNNNVINTNNNDKNSELETFVNKIASKYGNFENYLREYVKYIPLKYDANNNLVDYNPESLNSKDISMAVWEFI